MSPNQYISSEEEPEKNVNIYKSLLIISRIGYIYIRERKIPFKEVRR
jgi:hypothetical protein